MFSIMLVAVISAIEEVHIKDEEIHPCKCMIFIGTGWSALVSGGSVNRENILMDEYALI